MTLTKAQIVEIIAEKTVLLKIKA